MLGGVQLAEDGVAYVDLPLGGAEPPAFGSTEEMQRVYSLVNSVPTTSPTRGRWCCCGTACSASLRRPSRHQPSAAAAPMLRPRYPRERES